MERDDEIKLIAFRIWQEEGCCDGCDLEHWIRAEAIWEEQQKPKTSTAVASKEPVNTKKQPAQSRQKGKKSSHKK